MTTFFHFVGAVALWSFALSPWAYMLWERRRDAAWFQYVRDNGGALVFCPGCHKQLNGYNNQPFVYDDTGAVVTYTCACGAASRWLFDAPCPLLLRDEPTKEAQSV